MMCRLLDIPISHYRIVFPQVIPGTLAEIALASAQDATATLLAFNAPLISRM